MIYFERCTAKRQWINGINSKFNSRDKRHTYNNAKKHKKKTYSYNWWMPATNSITTHYIFSTVSDLFCFLYTSGLNMSGLIIITPCLLQCFDRVLRNKMHVLRLSTIFNKASQFTRSPSQNFIQRKPHYPRCSMKVFAMALLFS